MRSLMIGYHLAYAKLQVYVDGASACPLDLGTEGTFGVQRRALDQSNFDEGLAFERTWV